MKKALSLGYAALAIVIITMSACGSKSDNDPMILPNIVFKNTAGYTAKDTSVAAGVTLLTGINANKTEPNDVLKIFNITRSLDGATGTTVYNATLSGTDGDSYTKDYSITTRPTAGTEKYTYTVSNRDGLVNSISLTVTTH